MMQFIAPLIAVIIAVGAFFGYIDPAYDDIKELQAEVDEYNQALDKAEELGEVRDELLIKFNAFNDRDVERLEKLLPNNVDSVRLIIDMDAIASRYGLTIRDFGLSDSRGNNDESQAVSESQIQNTDLSFTVNSSYQNFIAFLRDLEKSLRLVDVTSVSFNASESNLYEYNVNLRTYWLR